MRCAETGRRRSGRPSRSKISSFKRSGINGLRKSPGKPVPSPRQRPRSRYPRSRRLLCWTARTPDSPGLRPRTGRRETYAGHPIRPVHIRRKRGSILPLLLMSPLLPACPPGPRQTEDVDIGLRHLGTVTTHHSKHRSRKSRSGERRPTASVSATPARPSGSGLPADGAALEQLLHQTLTRFTAAKTALPPFPYPGQGPAAATAPAPAAVAPLPKGLTPEEERAVVLLRAAPLVAPPSITRMLTPPRHGI